jgi:hypothetical protein
MIIVGIIEEQGPVPGATFLRTTQEVHKDNQGRIHGGRGMTQNATYTNVTASDSQKTINDWWQAGFLSKYTLWTWQGGGTVFSNVDTGWNAPNSSSYGMVAFSHTTTTSPLTARTQSGSFDTTTIGIISAKDITLGTSTDTTVSLTTIFSPTTTSVFKKTPEVVSTYSNRTDVVQVYTELVQYWTQQLCYSTRYEVFDNSDGVTLAIATAGNGGLVSYRTLSPGEVVGEESYKFVTYVSQIFTVSTENFIGSDYLPPPQTSNFSTTYAAVATKEVWYGGGGEDDAWFSFIETETESSVAYQISATANRGYIGTYDTRISSTSAKSIWEKMTTYTITDNRAVGDTTITVQKTVIPSVTNITTTIYNTNGAFVADNGAILFLTTATTRAQCSEATNETITGVKYKPYAVVQVVDGYSEGAQGNVIQSEIVTKDSFPWRNGPVYKIAAEPGFILEPVGPPCIGGYNATGPQGLGFDDNCPFSFPAYLLWEAANDSRYAAVSASSFYIGGIPLISHEKQWEWQGRTYAWLSLNANGGALRVDSGGTATPSSSFTIKVTGNCTYTGGLSEMHAGGRYYSSNSQAKATLVANSPLIVSVENTTLSFAAGTYEITQPMKILPDQYGSVVLAGLVSIYPPNFKNNPNAE